MTRLTGAWPGGPRRKSPPSSPDRKFRVDSTEARNERVDHARELRTRRRRTRRAALTLGIGALFASAVGLYLGLGTHKSSEDLTREREEAIETPAGGLVEELLSEPAVQEMLQGERAEAAAARNRR